MGHYASEMTGDPNPNYAAPKYVKKSPDDKPLRNYARGNAHEGSFTDVTEADEYAVQYDEYDWDVAYKRDEPGDPENWKYRRVRESVHGPAFNLYGDEALEKWIEHAKDIIKIKGDQDKTERPGLIMRRTVTYGPWEVLAQESEHDEGWY